jgi:hypothetical protein
MGKTDYFGVPQAAHTPITLFCASVGCRLPSGGIAPSSSSATASLACSLASAQVSKSMPLGASERSVPVRVDEWQVVQVSKPLSEAKAAGFSVAHGQETQTLRRSLAIQ